MPLSLKFFRNISVFMFVEKMHNSEGQNYRNYLNVYKVCRLKLYYANLAVSPYFSKIKTFMVL